jgi:hypothetical protein
MCRPCNGVEENTVIPQEFADYHGESPAGLISGGNKKVSYQ